MGIRKENFMRLHDKQQVAIQNKELFHTNFNNYMELDGKDHMIEIVDELGVSREDVKIVMKKVTRT